MKPKTVLMVALILGVAVLIFSTTAYLASGQSDQIVLNIAPQALAVGQSTSLNVQITAPSGAPVTGWQFDLSFDPATLQLNSVEEGSFFRQCSQASSTFFFPGTIDNQNGRLVGVAGAGLGIPRGKGCSGTGVVAILHFAGLTSVTPTFSLTNVILADPLVRAYSLRSYQVAGMLRQNVVIPTLGQGDIYATQIYIDEHSTLDPTEAAQATQLAYIDHHPAPKTPIPETPIYYSFQTPDDIPGLILADPFFIHIHTGAPAGTCAGSGTPGKALYVKSLTPNIPDYYLVNFYLNGQVCSAAEFDLDPTNSHAGQMGGWGGGVSLTADEAKAMFEKAGYSVVGDPYLVYDYFVDGIQSPHWQIKTQDNQTLGIVNSYDMQLIVTPEPTSNQP